MRDFLLYAMYILLLPRMLSLVATLLNGVIIQAIFFNQPVRFLGSNTDFQKFVDTVLVSFVIRIENPFSVFFYIKIHPLY